jgi:hypothetical protein
MRARVPFTSGRNRLPSPGGIQRFYALIDESAIAVLNETLASVKRQPQELSELANRSPHE